MKVRGWFGAISRRAAAFLELRIPAKALVLRSSAILVCMVLLANGTALFSFSEQERVEWSLMREHIIVVAEEALNAALREGGKFTNTEKERFQIVFYQQLNELDSLDLPVDVRFRDVILSRVFSYIKDSLSISADSSLGMSIGFVESVARNVCNGMQRAISREEPVPTGEQREEILQQAMEIKEMGRLMLREWFPDIHEEEFSKIVDTILGRVVDRVDCPFSGKSKRMLSDQEVIELYENWARILASDEERYRRINRKSLLFRKAADFNRSCSELFREE